MENAHHEWRINAQFSTFSTEKQRQIFSKFPMNYFRSSCLEHTILPLYLSVSLCSPLLMTHYLQPHAASSTRSCTKSIYIQRVSLPLTPEMSFTWHWRVIVTYIASVTIAICHSSFYPNAVAMLIDSMLFFSKYRFWQRMNECTEKILPFSFAND